MKNATRARLFTSTLLVLEEEWRAGPRLRRLHRERSMVELRRIAAAVWRDRTTGDSDPLEVVAGRGLPVRGSSCLASYSKGPRIVLARTQRNLLVLLHELAHALGSDREYNHGPAFRHRYHELLLHYGGN